MSHPARARVAELLVEHVDGSRTRGSGYLVGTGRVLTAAHVVDRARSVGVWLGAPAELSFDSGIGVEPDKIMLLPKADLALLPVAGQPVEPVLFGRLDRESVEPLPAVAVGCPRFMLRPAPGRPGVQLRDLHLAVGRVAGLSHAKTATLHLAVDPPAPPEDPQPERHSPWEGMSGAAVFAADSGRLIGVVGQHHPREGTGALTVRSVSPLTDVHIETTAAWRKALPQLPAPGVALDCVTPRATRELVFDRAHEAASALAPPVLIARNQELADLADLCQAAPRVRWIQADAFAGKTALLATFALHPPADLDVVACFLRRTTAQATADYALEVLCQQLAVYAGKGIFKEATFLRERVDDFFSLLADAASSADQRGRRLLLLIDGLDEDQTAVSGLTVASWLPGSDTLPGNTWLLVASRSGVVIPLADNHVLAAHVWHISRSEVAARLEEVAKRELQDAQALSERLAYSIVGLLAAAFGGLATVELTDLARRFGHHTVTTAEVNHVLAAALERSLLRAPDDDEPDRTVHAFGHELFLREARALFEDDLPRFRRLIDDWADDYADRGWPHDTPRYLLASYGRQITDAETLNRLVRFVTDPTRHDRMFARTTADAVALNEIERSQQLLFDQTTPNLAALALLAVERDRLAQRNTWTLQDLPSLLARLGQMHRALALARTLTSVKALGSLAQALIETGHLERARQIAATAVRVARSEPDPLGRTMAVSNLLETLIAAGLGERAVDLAAEAERLEPTVDELPQNEVTRLALVAEQLAAVGQFDHATRMATGAEQRANTISDPSSRCSALQTVTRAMVAVGQPRRATELALAAEQLVHSISDPGGQSRQMIAVAHLLAELGEVRRAAQLALDTERYVRRSNNLSYLAGQVPLSGAVQLLDSVGLHDRAAQLATETEQWARSFRDSSTKVWLFADASAALNAAGRTDLAMQIAIDAETLANAVSGSLSEDGSGRYTKARMFATVVGALAATGQTDRGLRLARTILVDEVKSHALDDFADALLSRGRVEEAEDVARAIPNRDAQVRKLIAVAHALACSGHVARAEELAAEAEQMARTNPDPVEQVKSMASAAEALIAARSTDYSPDLLDCAGRITSAADHIARSISKDSPFQRCEALTEVARSLASIGQTDRLEQVAADIVQAAQDDPNFKSGAVNCPRSSTYWRVLAFSIPPKK